MHSVITFTSEYISDIEEIDPVARLCHTSAEPFDYSKKVSFSLQRLPWLEYPLKYECKSIILLWLFWEA